MPLKERIFRIIDESEIELTPVEIARKLHANHSSVRVYLPQLLKEGRIVSPYHGAYCNKITHGMIFNPVRIHNLVVTAWVNIDEHYDAVEQVGTVKVRVVFGTQRQKVSIFISCDEGMDKNACLLALQRGFDIIRARIGRDVEQVAIRTFEANRDYAGIRLDREQCLTRKGLMDVIERVYQKDEVVRHEFKVTKDMTLTEFEALIKGGVTSFNVTQASFALVQEVKKLTEAQKMTNDLLGQYGRILDALLKRVYSDSDERSAKEEGRPPPDAK